MNIIIITSDSNATSVQSRLYIRDEKYVRESFIQIKARHPINICGRIVEWNIKKINWICAEYYHNSVYIWHFKNSCVAKYKSDR